MEVNQEQETRCRNLLGRITALQIDALQRHIRTQCFELLNQVQRAGQSGDTTLLKETVRRLGYSSSVNFDITNHVEDSNCTTSRRKSTLVTTRGPLNTYSERKTESHGNLPTSTPLSPNDSNNNFPRETDVTEQLVYAKLLLEEALKDLQPYGVDDTDSSSEEDSCNELEVGTKRVEHFLPVEETPDAKWARDRGDLGSSWTWLEDAISNNSFYLKQQGELRKHMRAIKTPVAFCEQVHVSDPMRILSSFASLKDARIDVYKSGHATMATCPRIAYKHSTSPVTLPPSLDVFTSSTSSQHQSFTKEGVFTPSCNNMKSTVGGGLEPLMINLEHSGSQSELADSSSVPRRCLPLKQFRARKVFRLPSHNASINHQDDDENICDCHGQESCATCVKSPEYMFDSSNRKVVMDAQDMTSLLDHTYHRNLSIVDEIPISTLLDASLSAESWKYNTPKSQSTFRSIVPRYRTGYERMRNSLAPGSSQKKSRGRPKTPKKVDCSTAFSKAAGVKKGISKDRTSKRISGDVNSGSRGPQKRRKYGSTGSAKKRRKESVEYETDDELCDGYLATASPKTTGPGRPRVTDNRRKRDQDYDINNIVIPYSIAAATRVEKIEYKEIMTPSWRVISPYNEQSSCIAKKSNAVDAELHAEDISDEHVKQRHEACEIEERKRFWGIDKPSTSRRSRRMNSKSEGVDNGSGKQHSKFQAPASPKVVADTLPNSPHQQEDMLTAAKAISAFDATVAVSAVKVNTGRKRRASVGLKREDEDDGIKEPYGYEIRQFPITPAEYTHMLEEMPEDFLRSGCEGK